MDRTCFFKESRQRFYDECCYNIDHLYPKWTENLHGNHPICIPECLDVNEKWIKYGDSEINQKSAVGQLRGEKCEKFTHAAVQLSTIGGFAIFDFNPFAFCTRFNINFDEGDAFQVDALLFHPVLGICEIETKARADLVSKSENGINCFGEKREQLKRHAAKLKQLYRTVTECNEEEVPDIYSFYFLPTKKSKISWTKSNCGKYYTVGDHIVLDKIFFEDRMAFMQFWDDAIEKQQHNGALKNYFQDKNFTRFMRIIAGYRSHDYVSLGSNVVAIYKCITEQPESSYMTEIDSQLIFFTAKQKAVVEEDDSELQIISGVPGSGKTIMLLKKALNAAQKPVTDKVFVSSKRKQKVFVLCGSFQMQKKYEQFFETNNQIIHREIILSSVFFAFTHVNAVSVFDDLFVDECSWKSFHLNILQSRMQAIKSNNGTGKTVVVVNDAIDDYAGLMHFGKAKTYVTIEQIVKEGKLLMKNHPNEWKFYFFNECMRCSGAIMNQWKNQFDVRNNMSIRPGHNIHGTEVLPTKSFQSIAELCAKIDEQVQNHLITVPGQTDLKLQMKDIAVLLEFDLFSLREKFEYALQNQHSHVLNRTNILYGTIRSQFENQSCVAIDYAYRALSCEWALVFVLGKTATSRFDEYYKMIARSRAVAKLIIYCVDFSTEALQIERNKSNYWLDNSDFLELAIRNFNPMRDSKRTNEKSFMS